MEQKLIQTGTALNEDSTLLCAYWRSGGQPLLQAISPRPLTARPTVSELIALLSGYFQDVGDL